MKVLRTIPQLALLCCCLALGISCSDDDNNTVPEPTFEIMEKSTSLGNVLTDSQGKTLYFFTKDADGKSACTGGCLTTWPVFNASAAPKLGAGLNATDFGTITRADGTSQTTFKGWPLYYYAQDASAGEVKGEGVGSVWFVAKTKYTVMLTDAQLVGNDGKSYKSDYTEGTEITKYFVDGMGRTLYAFAKDTKNTNSYTKSDFSNDATWPVYTVTSIDEIPSILDKSLFGTIDVFGKKQLTYKGWPIYYFGADGAVRGANKGVSVPKPGVWPIVQKDTPEAPTPNIMEKSSTLGNIITDENGKTLYFFTKDADGKSACTGGCLATWPVFYSATPKPAAGLNAADFGTITRADGASQTTYKGWPLYYYTPDAAAGDVKGEGVGTVWYVAKSKYSIMIADAQLVGNDGKSYKSDYTEGTAVTKYFVDGAGRTLYAFANDKKDKNNFTKSDFSNDASWPIYTTDLGEVPSTLDKTLFGTIDVFGRKQLTYKGWPLYYFGTDGTVRGSNKGVSVPTPGKWPVVQKDTPEAPL